MKYAFPQLHGTISIRLYSNIPFDNTYKNHSFISNLFSYNNNDIYTAGGNTIDCERFIDRKDYSKVGEPYYYPRYDITGDFNFDYGNGLITSVVLELTPEQTNANYLRVKSALNVGYEYYYYFITGITQINADTYRLSLELDVLMTYQNEFLEGMYNVPVFTTRKHCHRYTNDGLMPYCADYKTGEEMFSGVKPSLITQVHKLNYENSEMKKIKDVMWLYICVDTNGVTGDLEHIAYTCRDKTYPLIMMAVPINVNDLTYKKSNGTYIKTYTHSDLVASINALIGDGSVHGAKISPYPPFSQQGSWATITLDSSRNLTISSSSVSAIIESGGINLYNMTIDNNELIYGTISGSTVTLHKLLTLGFIIVDTQDDCLYEYEELTPNDFGLVNANEPTITNARYPEPKLLFSPFRKYKICGQYSNEGNEFFPELIFSEYETASNGHYFWFDTTATAYIGDNNFYTKIRASVDAFNNYQYEKIGLASAVNYIMPCGTDALDVFNSTQAQSFYTSKVASGVTSGLSILGGAGSIALGTASMVAPEPFLSKSMSVGLIAGGVTTIASGIAGLATTFKSVDAKKEDLKNTPDSVNVSGSNFITDEGITQDTNGLPYIIVYDVTTIVKENATDFFYNYGYQTARECYFNTELKYDNSGNHNIDNNLFGRTIFNYIQLKDDITNKINYNIPLIVKQKLSKIFNDGITLWTFFGFGGIYNTYTPEDSYFIDKWFMKCDLDNTEYAGDVFA